MQTLSGVHRHLIAWLLLLAACLPPGRVSGGELELKDGNLERRLGAIIRGATEKRQIALCFTAHSYAEGAETILNTLASRNAKASFFLTGDFLANTNFTTIIGRMFLEGHYVGPHSDKHLLYCGWEAKRPTLVERSEFETDVRANIAKIQRRFRAVKEANPDLGEFAPPKYFLPPYEHYNEEIAGWTSAMGLSLINLTPGTRSAADYTGEADKNFVASKTIYESILKRESSDPNGLNGFLLLLHLGAGPGRSDKFHSLFPSLVETLVSKGYRFVTVEELLKN